jgi:hypothetical protein
MLGDDPREVTAGEAKNQHVPAPRRNVSMRPQRGLGRKANLPHQPQHRLIELEHLENQFLLSLGELPAGEEKERLERPPRTAPRRIDE